MIIVYNNKVIHFPYNPKNHLPMQKTEPGIQCFASFCTHINNAPTDDQPTPNYIYAYKAYMVIQDSNASDDPSTPSDPASDDKAQEDPDLMQPPKTTGLSKCNENSFVCITNLATLVSASFKTGLATDYLNYPSLLPNARHQFFCFCYANSILLHQLTTAFKYFLVKGKT